MTPVALLVLFASVSQTFNLPEGLLSSVCFVESSYNVKAVHIDDGGADSIGVCQVQHSTARLFGFHGTAAQLQNPKINAYYAGRYLSWQLNRYDGNMHKAIAAYNAGSWRIRDGKTRNQQYVNKVFKVWKGH